MPFSTPFNILAYCASNPTNVLSIGSPDAFLCGVYNPIDGYYYAGTATANAKIWRSRNKREWTLVYTGTASKSMVGAAIGNGKIMFAERAGTAPHNLVSSNDGITWNAVPMVNGANAMALSGIALQSIYYDSLTAGFYIAGNRDSDNAGMVGFTVDGSNFNWSPTLGAGALTGITVSNGIIITSNGSGNIYSGNSLNTLTNKLVDATTNKYFSSDGKGNVLCTAAGVIFFSNDNGITWSANLYKASMGTIAVCTFVSAINLFAVCAGQYWYLTSNGSSWFELATKGTSFITPTFITPDPQTGYIVFGNSVTTIQGSPPF